MSEIPAGTIERLERMREIRECMPRPRRKRRCERCEAHKRGVKSLPPGDDLWCETCLAEMCIVFPSEVDAIIRDFDALLLKHWSPTDQDS